MSKNSRAARRTDGPVRQIPTPTNIPERIKSDPVTATEPTTDTQRAIGTSAEPTKSTDEEKLKDWMRARMAMLRSKYSAVKIVRATKWGNNGPTQVIVECRNADNNVESCDKTREINVQDLFQVRYCLTCKAREDKGKRKKSGGKEAEMKAEIERLQARLREKGEEI